MRFGDLQIAATVSIGVAALVDSREKSADELLATADCALYRAKGGGGNRVNLDPGGE